MYFTEIVLVFVRFLCRNCSFYFVLVFWITIILVLVLRKRRPIILVLVLIFVTKITLLHTHTHTHLPPTHCRLLQAQTPTLGRALSTRSCLPVVPCRAACRSNFPAIAGKAMAGMAHSDCGWTCGCAGKRPNPTRRLSTKGKNHKTGNEFGM